MDEKEIRKILKEETVIPDNIENEQHEESNCKIR